MLRLLIIASLAASAIVACASKPMVVQPPPRGTDARAEIDTLDREIADQLASASVPLAAPACAANQSCPAEPPPSPTCQNPLPACNDTCELAGSICKNAARICELAKQLGGMDAYANERCQSAGESCKTADQRCCACKP